MNEERIRRLMSRFDGVIKYTPMLQSHPDWTDDECEAFARKWHKRAQEQHAVNPAGWNWGIPYCRNVLKNLDAE